MQNVHGGVAVVGNFKNCGNLREHSQSVVLCKPCLDKKRCVRDGCNEKQMSGNRTLCMNHWRSENSKCKGKNGACMAACHKNSRSLCTML